MPTRSALRHAAVARQDAAERRHQRVDRVQRRVAVHAGMEVARARADAHVEGGEPARRDRDRRLVPVLHAAVEDHADVGAALVLLQELDDRLAADLLLAVGDDAEVDRQGRPRRRAATRRGRASRAGPCRPRHRARTATRPGSSPRTDRSPRARAAPAAGRRSGRTRGRSARRAAPFDAADLADDERPLPVRDELGLAAAAPDLVGEPLGGALEVALVRRIGAHGRDAQELAELVEPGLVEDGHPRESSQIDHAPDVPGASLAVRRPRNSMKLRALGWSAASGARVRRRPAPPAGDVAGQGRQATSRSFAASASARSFFRLWFSICRIRSRVTLNVRPTSSSVRGCSPSSP